MATGNDILSYRGDAGLGSGANAPIPVGANTNLNMINRTGEQLMLANMSQNKQLYDQKVQDRDQLLSQISSGDIKVGDLLEEDMPIVKEGLEKLDSAWEKWITGGKNDLGVQLEYKKQLREAQDRVTQAQGRKVFYDQEGQALSKETSARKQQARKQHLDEVIKGGFWKDLNPYQQTLDYDFDVIKGYVKPQTTTITDPNRPLYKGKRTYIDGNQVKAEATKGFLENNDEREYQQGLFQSYQSMPPQIASKELQAINNQLLTYNRDRGLQEGDPDFLQLNIEVDPQSGQFAINESVPEFAAKWAIANQQQFQQDEFEFDKDQANYQLGLGRNKIAAANAETARRRANSYIQLQNKKISEMDKAEKEVMGIWPKVIDKVKTTKTVDGSPLDVVWVGDLPRGYTNINGLDSNGKPIALTPFTGKRGELYFENIYTNQDGEPIDLRKTYNDYKDDPANAGKELYSYDEFMKNTLKGGGVNLEIKGKNGTADINSALETARALSNKLSAGKEESVFSESGMTIEE